MLFVTGVDLKKGKGESLIHHEIDGAPGDAKSSPIHQKIWKLVVQLLAAMKYLMLIRADTKE